MRAYALTVRACAVGLGLCGLVWAPLALMALPDLGTTRDLADRIASGDSFRPDVIRARADVASRAASTTCDAVYLRSAVLVEARAAELAVAEANLAEIDPRYEAVAAVAERLLDCAPTQALAWLSLFWVETSRAGLRPGALRLLAESYRVGRNETWIQVRRSALAMNLYGQLPDALKKEAVDEYLELVGLYQTDLVVGIYTRLDDGTRGVVQSRLNEVPAHARSVFARQISRAGLPIDLPGLLQKPDRPWLYN